MFKQAIHSCAQLSKRTGIISLPCADAQVYRFNWGKSSTIQCSGSGTLRSLQAPSMHTLHLVVATPTRPGKTYMHDCSGEKASYAKLFPLGPSDGTLGAPSTYNCKNLAFFTVLPPLRAMIIFWLSSRSELLHKNNGFMQTRRQPNEFNNDFLRENLAFSS